jgi:thiamine-phosphate pyrophosphorylase
MMIPKLHYIAQGNSGKELLENIQKACTSGIELVQLGIADISEKKFLKIAAEAREITAHYQTRLLIENQFKIAKDIKADGVVLSNKDISPTEVQKQLYTWQMTGEEWIHRLFDPSLCC